MSDEKLILGEKALWVKITTNDGIQNGIDGRISDENLEAILGEKYLDVSMRIPSDMKTTLTDQRMYGREIENVWISDYLNTKVSAPRSNSFASAMIGSKVLGTMIIQFKERVR